MSEQSYNTVNFRVLLAGKANSGKSSLVRQFVSNTFSTMHHLTLGPEMSQKIFYPQDFAAESQHLDATIKKILEDTCVRLTVVDCPGQDSTAKITPQALRQSDASFICFDVTYRASFDEVPKWLELVKSHSPNSMCILVGCKADLADSRAVEKSEASAWAAAQGLPYFETSAKENSNVQSTFKFMTVSLRERWVVEEKKRIEENQPKKNNAAKVQPGVTTQNKKKDEGGCCK
jgi:small GTP-binding protein